MRKTVKHQTHLQIGNMELEVGAQAVLLARHIVHRFERLLARLVARCGYQPVFSHVEEAIWC